MGIRNMPIVFSDFTWLILDSFVNRNDNAITSTMSYMSKPLAILKRVVFNGETSKIDDNLKRYLSENSSLVNDV